MPRSACGPIAMWSIAEGGSFPTDLYIIEGAMKSAGRPMQRRLIGVDGPVIDALLDAKRRRRGAVACRLSQRRIAQHQIDHRKNPRGRRAGDLGPLPFRGGHRLRLRPPRRRFRGRVHLQISQWRPGIAGLHFVARGTSPTHGIRCRAGGVTPRRSPSIAISSLTPGIKRFLCGTPPIISMRGVDAALDALDGVDIAALRDKSLALTDFSSPAPARFCRSLKS